MTTQPPHELTSVRIDAHTQTGPLELWRHSVGHGGINPLPLPDRVVAGIKQLRPRLVRIFIQEFFQVCPEPGRLDWSKLDPYMDSFDRMGAKIVAAICIKPRAIYPQINPGIWRPDDVAQWQHVIAEMVRRYSVERKLVTHWEVGNETDIGEDGGCPYHIPRAADYSEYYRMTIEPILRVFPEAKVGGPAVAWDCRGLLTEFAHLCRQHSLPLDFVSWHRYDSDPKSHAEIVRAMDAMGKALPGGRPELFITEWNRQLTDEPMVEDQAYNPLRAAQAAAILLDMHQAGVDWTFYYHLWDQVCRASDFAPFFTPRGVVLMLRHWNEIPHRLGLFSVDERVRPQYFLYRMLAELGGTSLYTHADGAVRVLASQAPAGIRALAVNLGSETGGGRSISWQFSGLRPGPKRLRFYRIDDQQRWCTQTLEMQPVESRDVWTQEQFECRNFLPPDTVGLLCLDDQVA
jgi:xylan 1,4-beta-xylosidase